MTTHTTNAKTPTLAACRGLLALLALSVLPLLGTTLQAQTLRLQQLVSPTIAVEAGPYRHVVSVGAPTLGTPMAVHRALYRFGSAGSTEASLEVAHAVPSSFALESNYPNPFNPTTTVPFALPESSEVTIVVYDVTGRRVAVLFEGERSAGRHEVQFRAEALPSGMYLVRMQAGAFSEVRRMTLIK